MKYCVICKDTKPLSDYYVYAKKDRPNPNVFSYCKKCTLQQRKDKREVITHNKKCEYCGIDFVSKRFDARFCCDYHSALLVIDPERKRLKKKIIKEENSKLIYDANVTVNEIHEKTGIAKSYLYQLRKNIVSNKIKKEKVIKEKKEKFKYEDNFKVKKEPKEIRIEKWNKIFKEIQCK